MRMRQVHLDFHTCEKIPGIGSAFSKEQFQSALKACLLYTSGWTSVRNAARRLTATRREKKRKRAAGANGSTP